MSPAEDEAPIGYDALYEDAACGLLLTDADGLISLANRTFCQWIGVDRAELVGKRRFQDLLTMGGRIFHQTHWAPLLRMQGSIAEVKLDLARSDGPPIPMVMNAIRREHGGRSFHELALFVAEDRNTYERELMRARKRAEDLLGELEIQRGLAEDRARFAEQMVGIVSHDLRNPLSTISLGGQALRMAGLPEPQARMLGSIMRATDRALRMISDLLDFTQARIGKGLTVDIQPIDLHAVVAAQVDELAMAYPGRSLLHHRTGEGPCMADGDRLAQLVGNLVSNALAYGDAGSAVTVTTDIGAAGFSITVHNSGAPIDPEILPTLFQPMVRGGGANHESRSVGLGLYIVAEIACAHGSRVGVTSTESGGTEFRVDFPGLSAGPRPPRCP